MAVELEEEHEEGPRGGLHHLRQDAENLGSAFPLCVSQTGGVKGASIVTRQCATADAPRQVGNKTQLVCGGFGPENCSNCPSN